MNGSGRVVLSVPARGEFARTARLVAAELAAHAGMCIDDVDDVRLAIDEAFVYACDLGPSMITLEFEVDEGSVGLTMGPLPVSSEKTTTGETGERYARFILEAICDEFEIRESGGESFVRLVKRTG